MRKEEISQLGHNTDLSFPSIADGEPLAAPIMPEALRRASWAEQVEEEERENRRRPSLPDFVEPVNKGNNKNRDIGQGRCSSPVYPTQIKIKPAVGVSMINRTKGKLSPRFTVIHSQLRRCRDCSTRVL